MSNNTIELDKLIKFNFDFGLKDYPIFDENYRSNLNQKILDHYRFREIGQETPARFKFYLNRSMNENMPLFNQRYKSTLLEYEPLLNIDISDSNEIDNTLDGTSENNANTLLAHSDLPQGTLMNLLNYDHLTNADNNTIASDTTLHHTGRQTSSSSKQGAEGTSKSELLLTFRKTFLNIDMEVIESLSDLFYGLY